VGGGDANGLSGAPGFSWTLADARCTRAGQNPIAFDCAITPTGGWGVPYTYLWLKAFDSQSAQLHDLAIELFEVRWLAGTPTPTLTPTPCMTPPDLGGCDGPTLTPTPTRTLTPTPCPTGLCPPPPTEGP
jgi:hypothetical protein